MKEKKLTLSLCFQENQMLLLVPVKFQTNNGQIHIINCFKSDIFFQHLCMREYHAQTLYHLIVLHSAQTANINTILICKVNSIAH